MHEKRRKATHYVFRSHESIKKALWRNTRIIELIIPKSNIQLVKKICSDVLICQENNLK